jgi:ferritin-like protein
VTETKTLHEPRERLNPDTLDQHRAYESLREELEAIDWYSQRIDATSDDELKRVLAHNCDEEKEHAAMVLEWLRRRDPAFDRKLRAYLFTTGRIERERQARTGPGAEPDQSLGLGDLKKSYGVVP